MIKTINIQIANPGKIDLIPTKAVIFNDYLAIHCHYSRQDADYCYAISHVSTGRQVWRSWNKKAILLFASEIKNKNLNWHVVTEDYRSIPSEIVQACVDLIRTYEKLFPDYEEDEDTPYDDEILKDIRQSRINRKKLKSKGVVAV